MARTALLTLAALLGAFLAAPRAQAGEDLRLSLDAEGPGWTRVAVVADGARGGAAAFADPAARIDAGPCAATSAEGFTLTAHVRTREAGFSTALMAREDSGAVAMSLVMGRRPGCVSFEAWSWASVRLVSTTRVDDGKWHAIEASYDPASRFAILLVDGRVEAWGNLGEGGAPAARLRLGNNIGADQPFRGDLDEVAVVRRTTHGERFAGIAPVLSDAEKAAALRTLRERALPRTMRIPTDATAWEARRRAIRGGILDALGLDPAPKRVPLAPVVHGTTAGEGFDVSRVSWTSFPETRATGWLWQPNPKRPGRCPALLSPHGHWAGGAIDPVVQARASRFARDGWIVLVPDSVHVEDVASGVSAIGVMTWNNVRGIDLLLEREDVDPSKVAVTGASGGGQQTMYLMALEDRLAAAAPISMISYFNGILADDTAHCACNHAPRVAFVADEPEMCATFAPKPVFYGSVTGDWTHDFSRHGLPEIRAVYRLLGRESAVEAKHLDLGHNYGPEFRAGVHEFFDRVLLSRGPDPAATEAAPVPLERLRALGPPPAAPDRAALAKEFLGRRPRATSPQGVAPGLPWNVGRGDIDDLGPAAPGSPWNRGAVRGEDGVPIPMLLRDGRRGEDRPWTVFVAPGGHAALLLDPPEGLATAERAALVDVRFTGEWSRFADAWRRNALLLGRGEGYQAAHDLALVAKSLPGGGRVTVVARDWTGKVAVVARYLTDRIEATRTEGLASFPDDGNPLPSFPEILRLGFYAFGSDGYGTDSRFGKPPAVR